MTFDDRKGSFPAPYPDLECELFALFTGVGSAALLYRLREEFQDPDA
jgi:hypothetical protein